MRQERYLWVEGGPTLPPGWRSRRAQTKQFFLSPDGAMFSSRRAGLQHLAKEGRGEEAEAMRALLVHEGWQGSQDLPAGWRFRIIRTRTRTESKFLTEDGEELRSLTTACEYITSSTRYSREERQRFFKFYEGSVSATKWQSIINTSRTEVAPQRPRRNARLGKEVVKEEEVVEQEVEMTEQDEEVKDEQNPAQDLEQQLEEGTMEIEESKVEVKEEEERGRRLHCKAAGCDYATLRTYNMRRHKNS